MGFNKKKLFLVGFFSNVCEWYDFAVYAYLASIIGVLFFHETNAKIALIKSFSVFGVSYLARPLGSILFGYISDHFGRSKTLKISLIMMAIPTVAIGVLPTYQSVGIYAVYALILLRLIQGIAAGGELPGSTCYMYEAAPRTAKNFYCSFVAASSMLGVFLGSLVVTILHLLLSQSSMHSWGWRVPFLLGLPIAYFIFWLRNNIPETDEFINNDKTHFSNYFKILIQHKYQVFQVFMLNAFISVAFYLLFVWMPSYLQVYLNINTTIANLSNSIALFLLIILTLIVGFFASDVKRKKWIVSSILLMAIFIYPVFLLLKAKSILFIFTAQIIFAVILSLIDGVINATMGSLFQPLVRGMGVSIGFTFSTALLGGLSPAVVSWLTYYTGNDSAPILFIIAMAVLSLPFVRIDNHTT